MRTLLRRHWPPGIRWQLMAWYTSVFALLLLFTGALFYQHLETSLEASVDATLQLRAQQIASELVVTHETIALHDLTVTPSGEALGSQAQWLGRDNVDYGELVRLLNAQGHLLSETPAFRAVSVPQTSITQPLQGTPWQGTVVTVGDREVRVYSRAFTQQNQVLAIIQVGESLTSLHTLLHALVEELLLVGALVLLVCAVGSYWLAARSFAPIQRLAETARRIQAGNLQQRVPMPAAQDEIHYLAQTFNTMLDSIEQSFVRQRRFVADASHELRTPVAVLRNKADVALLKSRSPEDYARVLREVSTEAERLGQLVSDLLLLARGDEGRAAFAREKVSLQELASMVVAYTQPLAEERGLRVCLQEASARVVVWGDEARLVQVVLNLVENALTYTHPGGKVTVSASIQQDKAVLRVQDTGVGIAAEHLPHVFERFYRGDQARQQTQKSSSGLGLAIAEWIVQAHHGTITLVSQVGVGSTFTVLLPLEDSMDLSPDLPLA